jgi:hypothetical protein
MQAIQHDPRRVLLAALAALILTLAVLAAPRAVSDIHVGGSAAASAPAAAPAPPRTSAPVWRTDPLASPIAELRRG